MEDNILLHVVSIKGEYIDITNSSKMSLSELKEMKSCIYRVDAANAGMGL